MGWLANHPVIAVVLFIGFLVFVHETGHFLVGKAFGIGVEVYSIGFGPRLLGFSHQGTVYQISLLPLGGYVKFAGALPSEEIPEHFKGQEMHRASLTARTMTILAGPLANLLLAAVIYGVHGYRGIEHPPAVVGMVMSGSAGEKGGLQVGDRVLEAGKQKIRHWTDLKNIIVSSAGEKLRLTVQRHGEIRKLEVRPTVAEGEDGGSTTKNQGRLGISFGMIPPLATTIPLPEGESPAQKAGLRTGDKITGVAWHEELRSISSWHDVLRSLEAAHISQPEALSLIIDRSPGTKPPPEQEKSLSTKTTGIKLVLETGNWSRIAFDQSRGRTRYLKELASTLGLSDSQLTLQQARKPLDKVLRPFDKLLSFNHQPLEDIFDLFEVLDNNRTPEATVSILREGRLLETRVTMEPIDLQRASGKVTRYSFPALFLGAAEAPEPVMEVHDGFFSAALYGIKETTRKAGAIVSAIQGLITGNLPLKSLGGPMLIAKVAGDAAEAGLQAFFSAMAVISINLGVLNLFPIPGLDGGQLLLVGAEAVHRRRLSEVAIENFQRIGFVMILALVVLATYNDLSRFWSAVLRGVTGYFN